MSKEYAQSLSGYHLRLIVDAHKDKLYKCRFTCPKCGLVEEGVKDPTISWECGNCSAITWGVKVKVEQLSDKPVTCRCDCCTYYRGLTPFEKMYADQDYERVIA